MGEVAKTGGERGDEKLHFLDYWRVVKKRKEIIIAILIIIVFATFVFSTIAKPVYSAYSIIKITQWQRPMDPFATERARYIPFDQHEFETHLASLESDAVLEKVVKGEIYGDRSFWECPVHHKALTDQQAADRKYKCTEPLAGGGACGASLREVRQRKYPEWEPLTIKWAGRDSYPRGSYTLPGAVSMLKRNLRVRPEKGTRLIKIIYESHDKKEAQLIADMVAEAYIQWMDELRNERLQRAFKALRKEIHIYQFGGPGQSRGLNDDYAAVIEMKSKLRLDSQDQRFQVQELLGWTHTRDEISARIAEQKSDIEKLSVMNDEQRAKTIQDHAGIYRLTAELGTAEAELSALLTNYAEEHWQVKAQQKRISKIKDNLYDLASGVLASKEAELAKLEEYEKKLNDIIDGLNEQVNESEQRYSEYLVAKANVGVKTVLLQQMEESQIEEKITNAMPSMDIQLFQQAKLPASAARPRPIFNVIVSLFVGLTLGTGVAYFVEYLDTSMKTVDDVERYLNMPTLAVIPQQKEGLLIHQSPKSHAAENYRMLWTNIEFARKEGKFKNIMVTSGGAAEGKTTTVVNLGIAAAQMGARVLVVDSDLRRPKIHKLLKYSNRVGLSDVLLKDANPRDVILGTEVPRLWVMPSGKLPSNVIGLLNSQKMRDIIATLSEDFDVLLYDSPPVMGVSDASVMAGVMERVLMVIDYRKYPKRLAMRAKRNLENVGGVILGAIINNLNVLKEDYYYYGYGYGKAYHYYYSKSEEEEEAEEKEPVEVAKATESAGGGSNPDS